MGGFFEFVSGFKLEDWGSIASITGLVITVVVFFNIRKIKEFYIFKGRVPELLVRLAKHASNLSAFHKEFEDSLQQIEEEVGLSEITLKSLKKIITFSKKFCENCSKAYKQISIIS